MPCSARTSSSAEVAESEGSRLQRSKKYRGNQSAASLRPGVNMPRFAALIVIVALAQQAVGLLIGLSVHVPIRATPARLAPSAITMKQRKEDGAPADVATDIDVTPAAEEIILGDDEHFDAEKENDGGALLSLGTWRTSYNSAASSLAQARAAQEDAISGQLKAEADFYAALERAKVDRAQEVAKWQQVAAEAAEVIVVAEADLAAALAQAETEEVNAKAAVGQQLAEAEEALQRAVDEAAEEATVFATAKSRLTAALEDANTAAAAAQAKAKAELDEMAEKLRQAEERAAKAKAAAVAAIGNL